MRNRASVNVFRGRKTSFASERRLSPSKDVFRRLSPAKDVGRLSPANVCNSDPHQQIFDTSLLGRSTTVRLEGREGATWSYKQVLVRLPTAREMHLEDVFYKL